MPHKRRPAHDPACPVHVTVRAVRGLRSLRSLDIARELGRAFHRARRRGRGVAQFSIQDTHLHLIFEAPDRQALMRNVRGVAISIAKAVNRATGRQGKVFDDRYHLTQLFEPRSVRAALVYVLMNHKKHGMDELDIDPRSSARWFDGFRTRLPEPTSPSPVSTPTTELLRSEWRSCGLIRIDDCPRNCGPGPRGLAEMLRHSVPQWRALPS